MESIVSSNGAILIRIGYWSVSVVKPWHAEHETHAYRFRAVLAGKLRRLACLLFHRTGVCVIKGAIVMISALLIKTSA